MSRRRVLGPQTIHLIRETADQCAEIEKAALQARESTGYIKKNKTRQVTQRTAKRAPSETQLILHPTLSLSKCKCGVRFVPSKTPGDDPRKCQTCNRVPWSKLFC